MDFCKECGQKIEKKDLEFCVNCGTSLTSDPSKKEEASQQGAPVSAKQAEAPKKPMTKKQKRLMIFASAAAVLFISLYFIGNTLTSQERLVNNFTDAIKEEDAEKLADTLSFYESDEEIEAGDVEGFLALLEEDQDSVQEIIDSLNKQSETMNNGDIQKSELEKLEVLWFSSGDSNHFIILEEGDGFLFYDTYELKIDPVYVTLSTNVDGTAFYADEKEITTSDSSDYSYEFGPLVPGRHTFKAVNETNMIDLSTEEEVVLTRSGENVHLNLDAGYVRFDMNIPPLKNTESRLIVNDEEVDFDIFSEEEFGPVTLDGSTTFTAEIDYPWGTMTTPKKPIEGHTARIDFTADEKLQESLGNALIDHTKLYLTSWQENDPSKLEYMAPDRLEIYEKDFDRNHKSKSFYEKQVTGVKLDSKNMRLDQNDGTYFLYAQVQEDTIEANYWSTDHREPKDESWTYQYEFVYDDGWSVYDKGGSSYSTLDAPIDLGLETERYIVQGSNANQELGPETEVASEEVSNESEDADDSYTDSNIESITLGYIENLVEAINQNDYNIVRPFIKDGSALQAMQAELVDHLNDSGMSQELLDAEVTDIEETGEGQWIVTTNEKVKLIYQSGKEETEEYEWKYTAEISSDGSEIVLSNME
ncbi:zinc ribbon domain-containing protein [Virgibacillus ainsalahensis]